MDMGQPLRPQPPMVSVRLLSGDADDAEVQAAEAARRARAPWRRDRRGRWRGGVA